MENLIGRKQETQELENLYNSKKPEFVAIYGRIRHNALVERYRPQPAPTK